MCWSPAGLGAQGSVALRFPSCSASARGASFVSGWTQLGWTLQFPFKSFSFPVHTTKKGGATQQRVFRLVSLSNHRKGRSLKKDTPMSISFFEVPVFVLLKGHQKDNLNVSGSNLEKGRATHECTGEDLAAGSESAGSALRAIRPGHAPPPRSFW